MKKIFAYTFLFFSFFGTVPLISHAAIQCPASIQSAPDTSLLLVRCKYGQAIVGNNGQVLECECGFKDVIAELKKIINFIFLLALPVTVIAIAISGIRILFSMGKPGEMVRARKMLMSVIIGFLYVLGAWLLVYTIVSYLLRPEYYTPFLGSDGPNQTSQ
ncbi:MAG: hypothetical protein K0S38_481 [Candidatus Paceibacter sp.]|jgi:hypothetical protein|nr:hypothetical protein [Candidatus Paceibacter sp.]